MDILIIQWNPKALNVGLLKIQQKFTRFTIHWNPPNRL